MGRICENFLQQNITKLHVLKVRNSTFRMAFFDSLMDIMILA